MSWLHKVTLPCKPSAFPACQCVEELEPPNHDRMVEPVSARLLNLKNTSSQGKTILTGQFYHPKRRQDLWREFLMGEDPRERAIRRQEWALGDADFCRQLAAVLGRPLPARRGRPGKPQATQGYISL